MEQKIIELWKLGWAKKKIAREVGCTFYKVNRALIEIEGAVTLPKESVCEKIIEDWNNNLRKSQLVKKYKLDLSTIQKVLISKNADISRKRKLAVNTNAFKTLDTEQSVYWLGFLMADGYINEKENHIDISLKNTDTHQLEKFKSFLQTDAIVKQRQISKYFSCRLTVCSKDLVSQLVSYGCRQAKSLVLKFPTIPKHLMHHFIRGYFDGDGSVSYNKTSKAFAFHLLGTQSFLESARKELGLSNTKLDQKGQCYDLRYGGRGNAKKIYDYLYKDATLFLERKREVFDAVFE